MTQSGSTRRDFLQSSAATMLASGMAPAILGADDKSDSRPKVVGPEGHRYEIHHDCMKSPIIFAGRIRTVSQSMRKG